MVPVDVVRDLSLQRSPHAVTIGAYDGVHVGHQMIIASTREAAASQGVKSAVVTFDPHPAYVVRPESAPKLLTTLDQKLELLESVGVDTVVVVPFDRDAASESAEAFVDRVLVGCLSATSVVVGENFHFGRAREGTVDLLTKLGQLKGFAVAGLGLATVAGIPAPNVSSTTIRQALVEGNLDDATTMLGRFHEISGVVAHGDKRGRTIGFPTANVDIGPEFALPCDGVYAGWFIDEHLNRCQAAINIGKRPTFYNEADRSLTEAHLLDFDGDLYGQTVRVQFVKRLRDERPFAGIDELTQQLSQDIGATRRELAR